MSGRTGERKRTDAMSRCQGFLAPPAVLVGVSCVVGLLGVADGARAQTCAATDTAVTEPSPTDAATLTADCTALLQVMDTLRNTAPLNWAKTVSMADWDGISLKSGTNDRVEQVLLDNRSLDGFIPDLSGLTGLTNLSLHNNELIGSIPLSLGNLTGLDTLHLAGNNITGDIPSALGGLTSLSELSLCETDLDSNATLPAALEARRTGGTLTVRSCVTLTEDPSMVEGEALVFPVRHSTFPLRGTPGATDLELSWTTTDGTATSAD